MITWNARLPVQDLPWRIERCYGWSIASFLSSFFSGHLLDRASIVEPMSRFLLEATCSLKFDISRYGRRQGTAEEHGPFSIQDLGPIYQERARQGHRPCRVPSLVCSNQRDDDGSASFSMQFICTVERMQEG